MTCIRKVQAAIGRAFNAVPGVIVSPGPTSPGAGAGRVAIRVPEDRRNLSFNEQPMSVEEEPGWQED
jgi:hypothetical protein